MTKPGTTNLETIDRARRSTAAERYDITSRFPSVFASADGSWMTDVEGNRVLDLTAASGTLLLGNRHPVVVEAMTTCVRDYGGVFASTLTPQRIELAERLCARYPAGEKAVFCRTGSEATTAAMRLARAATGRDLILTSGYHGWHDWQLSYLRMGYEPATRVANFAYNETVLSRLLDEFADEIAAVYVTPEPTWLDADYYKRLSALCSRHGVLFMMDEIITGVRYGPRGLNGTGEVPADVITVGKGLSNGHGMSAVLGRREVMDAFDDAVISSAYSRDILPMAVSLAVLDVIDDPAVLERTQQMGRLLKDGMRDVLSSVGIPAFVDGPDMLFDVVLSSDELSWDIYRAAYDHGVWFEDSGTQMVTAAFGPAEVQHALDAFEKAARHVAQTRDITPGDLPEDRKTQFVIEAFGGQLHDTDEVLGQLDTFVEQVAKRDRTLITELDPSCG
jgi:glutamate-1-semialdehyde 2,1-aminomutase